MQIEYNTNSARLRAVLRRNYIPIECIFIIKQTNTNSSDTMDLTKALDEAKLAINLFFNNKFVEARALMKPW